MPWPPTGAQLLCSSAAAPDGLLQCCWVTSILRIKFFGTQPSMLALITSCFSKACLYHIRELQGLCTRGRPILEDAANGISHLGRQTRSGSLPPNISSQNGSSLPGNSEHDPSHSKKVHLEVGKGSILGDASRGRFSLPWLSFLELRDKQSSQPSCCRSLFRR